MRRQLGLPLLLLTTGLLWWACDSRSAWEGRYVGQPKDGASGSVTLVVLSGGKGEWTSEQESISLRWEERGGALWLHLKTGGVLVGQSMPAEKALIFELPGIGTLLLRRASP
jgi:hypothetical protein